MLSSALAHVVDGSAMGQHHFLSTNVKISACLLRSSLISSSLGKMLCRYSLESLVNVKKSRLRMTRVSVSFFILQNPLKNIAARAPVVHCPSLKEPNWMEIYDITRTYALFDELQGFIWRMSVTDAVYPYCGKLMKR